MGKGDQRSRRGKIHRGTFGRKRPRKSKAGAKPVAAVAETAKKPTRKEAAAAE
jgi:30S ribosomal protein S31